MASKSPANQRAKKPRAAPRKKPNASDAKEIQNSLKTLKSEIDELFRAYKKARSLESMYAPALREEFDYRGPLEEIDSSIEDIEDLFFNVSSEISEHNFVEMMTLMSDETIISIAGLSTPALSECIDDPLDVFDRIIAGLSEHEMEDDKEDISTVRNFLRQAGYELICGRLSRSISNLFRSVYRLRIKILSAYGVNVIISEKLASILIEEDRPHLISLADVVQMIDENYQYTPTAFTATSNSGSVQRLASQDDDSCKIFAWAKSKGIDHKKVLNMFPTSRTTWVINPSSPRPPSPPSLSSIIYASGWESLNFDSPPLKKKRAKKGAA